MMEGVQEFLDVAHEITARDNYSFVFDTNILNYDSTNISSYSGKSLSDNGVNLYLLLKNSLGVLNNYLLTMSDLYISDSIS